MFRTSKVKGVISSILIIGILLIVLAGCSSTASAPTAKAPVVIGLVNDESGAANAPAGRSIMQGCRLAVDDWNKKGGVLGGRPVEYIARDNGGDPTKATSIAKEFVSNKVVAVMGGTSSTDAIPMSKIFAEAKIPFVNDSSSIITAQNGTGSDGKQYAFTYVGGDFTFGAGLAKLAAELGFKKIAFANVDQAWGRGCEATYKRFFPEYGLQNAGAVWLDVNAKDFTPQVKQLMDLKPDAYMPCQWGAILIPWIRACHDLNNKIPIVYYWPLIEPAWKTLDRSFTSGGYITCVNTSSDLKPSYIETKKRFVQTFGREAETDAWTVGYQGTYDLLTAINAVGTDSVAVRDYMATKLKGQAMIMGHSNAVNPINETDKLFTFDNVNWLTPITADTFARVRINTQGDKEWIKP